MADSLHPGLSRVELPLVAAPDEADAERLLDAQARTLQYFDECAPRVQGYVRSFGLTPDAAEDVVQEVFLALYRHLLLGRPQHNLRSWLFRVAHNAALKHRQRSQRQHAGGDSFDDAVASLADTADDPEERMTADQRRKRLWAVVGALRERDRQCLLLRAEGLSYRDIAAALGISLGGVAKSLGRTFARLMSANGGWTK
jgi:RNA polymerase sigma-70 factor (ECF subfamily)